MKKKIYSKFYKNKIALLPIVEFPGEIVVVDKAEDTADAVADLLKSDILGIDTETRPIFKKGTSHKVALLQVSNHTKCYLFRLNLTDITDAIKKLLENTRIPMVGLSLHDDILALHRRADFVPGRFFELQNIVGDIGIEDLSLQKVYANLFGLKISKRQRLSNWEAATLTDKQQIYAATDAWTCINIFEEVCRLKVSQDYELIKVPDPKLQAAPTEQTTADKSETEELKADDATVEKSPRPTEVNSPNEAKA